MALLCPDFVLVLSRLVSGSSGAAHRTMYGCQKREGEVCNPACHKLACKNTVLEYEYLSGF